MRFDLGDQLHGADFRRAAQRAGGEGVDECLNRVAVRFDHAADARNQMDHVAVILRLLIEIYFHVYGVAAQVVAGEIDEHHVFRVLLRIPQQRVGQLLVFQRVAGAPGRTGARIDTGAAVLHFAVGFRRRSENAKLK